MAPPSAELATCCGRVTTFRGVPSATSELTRKALESALLRRMSTPVPPCPTPSRCCGVSCWRARRSSRGRRPNRPVPGTGGERRGGDPASAARDREDAAASSMASAANAARACSTRWSSSWRSSRRRPPRMSSRRRGQSSARRCGVHAQDTFAQALPRASAARAHRRARPDVVRVLRLDPARQARRGRHRDAGGGAAALEGSPDVREKFTCRACEAISQAPAPFHVLSRGWAGPSLLAMILFEKYGQHQPLNRQASAMPARASVSACRRSPTRSAAARRSFGRLRSDPRHVFAAARLHGDDTPVPVLAKGKTGPAGHGPMFATIGPSRSDPPAAVLHYSRDRAGEHPEQHLAGFDGILQADAFAGFNRLYDGERRPGPLTEAACWAHGQRKFFELADSPLGARQAPVIAPIALEAVQRIDAIFAIEREINGQPAEARLAARQQRIAPLRPRTRSLDAGRARPAVPPCRGRQSLRLHAEALGRLHRLPCRWPHLPHQQRGRAGAARHRARPQGLAVCRFRPRRRTRRRHLQPDCHRQLNDVDPQAWLTDVLARIADHPIRVSTSCFPGTGASHPPITPPRLPRPCPHSRGPAGSVRRRRRRTPPRAVGPLPGALPAGLDLSRSSP